MANFSGRFFQILCAFQNVQTLKKVSYQHYLISESNQLEQSMAYFDVIPPDKLNIEAYEVLFKALAREGMLEDLQRFWSNLKKSAIKPSLKCYIAAFQCLGHQKTLDQSQQNQGNLLRGIDKKTGRREAVSFFYLCFLSSTQ